MSGNRSSGPSERGAASRASARPRAVTVAAAVASLLAVANLVALVAAYDPDTPGKTAGSLAATALLAVTAVGLWRSRYWGVLGMETLLALTIVFAALALIRAADIHGVLLLVAIIAGAGTLLVALARSLRELDLPTPSAQRPGGSERKAQPASDSANEREAKRERSERKRSQAPRR